VEPQIAKLLLVTQILIAQLKNAVRDALAIMVKMSAFIGRQDHSFL
jgi:hypothetical protein